MLVTCAGTFTCPFASGVYKQYWCGGGDGEGGGTDGTGDGGGGKAGGAGGGAWPGGYGGGDGAVKAYPAVLPKALVPMVQPGGTRSHELEVQPWKALLPMDVTPDGRAVWSASAVQPSKA